MLRTRNSWLLLAIVLLPLPFLLLKALGPGEAVWAQHLWDTAHLPLFAAWMFAAMRLSTLPQNAAFITLRASLLLALGIGIEIIQRETGRSFSWLDVYLDICGIALGLRLAQHKPRRAKLLDATLLLLIFIGLKDAGMHLFDRAYMSWQFPQLWHAGQPNADLRIGGLATHRLVQRDAMPLLEVTHGTQPYSGFELLSLMGDWRGFKTLRIDILNPSANAIDIVCRVHDEPHYGHGAALNDRFNRHFLLQAGWNTLSIALAEIESAPATRRMQMDDIENLSCFTIALREPRTLYYREIYLLH